jgi:hypothetical protein
MIGMIMTQSTLLHKGLNEFWTILTISRLSPHAFTWDTWNWTNSNTANPRNSCVTNGTERICVFVRYCANIVLNIIKCSQPRSQAHSSYGEKTRLVGAGHVTHRKWIAVGNVPLVQSGFEFWNPIIDFQFHLTKSEIDSNLSLKIKRRAQQITLKPNISGIFLSVKLMPINFST